MSIYDDYLASEAEGAPPEPTPVQRSMSDFNKKMSGNAQNKYTDYLQEESGMTPEKKARMQANLTRIQAKTGKLRAESDAATSPLSYARAAGEGLATGLGDIADTATLGGYRKVRDYAYENLSSDKGQSVRDMEAEQHAPVKNNPLMRAAQMGTDAARTAAGYGMGAANLLGRAGMEVTKRVAPKVGPVIADFLGGATGGGLTTAAESTIAGDSPLATLKKTGMGAAGGGTIGTAIGIGGRAIAGAPKRAVESEMAGLTEGVGYKTKITKFLPKEESIRAELSPRKGTMHPADEAEALSIRRAIKDDPQAALPAVEKKLGKVANEDLEPFYVRMEYAGADKVDVNRVNANLAVVRDSFTKSAEKGQRAAVQNLMDDLEETAAGTGYVPARTLREEATAYQGQGFANVPVFGQVQLSKQAKQGMGGALRESIAEHLDDMAPNGGLGDAFRNANKRVAAWYGIKNLLDEKVARLKTKSMTAADMLKTGLSIGTHPVKAAIKYALPSLGPGAESIDRNIIAPLSQNPTAQAIGGAIKQTGPAATASQFDMLQRAREEKRRRDAEAAGMLYQE